MIVVGTTPDYVERISRKHPIGSVLFILDQRHLNSHLLSGLDRSILIFADLEKYDETLESLKKRLSQAHVSDPCFACFDCESLIMASRLADYFRSPFPPTEAILITRSKFLSREVWRKAGLDNPRAVLASDIDETLRYFHVFKRDIVLKPISGSGSELVFRCVDEECVRKSVSIMQEQLEKRRYNPLFRPIKNPFTSMTMDPCEKWVVEEYVSGPEFSCDFMLEEDNVTILRETGKIRAEDQTFGSVMAYTMPSVYPEGFRREDLYRVFPLAAKSLGFKWGHFMVDFIISKNSVVIIELAPRPGGDSIPDLLEAATGRDLLQEHLKIMADRFDKSMMASVPGQPHASINLFMPGSGLITHLDASEIIAQPQVRSVLLKKKVGDRVTLPPDDYDNRLVGNCIVRWDYSWDPISTCRHFQRLLKISVDNGHSGYQDSDRRI
jgi:biotin carboxylase